MQVIIFPQGDKVGVVIPAPEYADQVEAVAAKDVPFQKEWVSTGTDDQGNEVGYFRDTVQVWRIVDDSDLPPRDARDRWLWADNGPLTVLPE